MLRALLVVSAIGIADSLNPSTVGPAALLALAPRAGARILQFAAGVFVTNLVAGILLLLGPGQWLLSLLPHTDKHHRHLFEVVGGFVLLIGAVVIWAARRRLAGASTPGSGAGGRSAFVAGATLMLAELPTAFPYFGAIAVIVGANISLPVELALIALFNLLFAAPLLAIAVVIHAAPALRRSVLEPAAAWLARRWPVVFAGLAALLGVVLATVGVVGLVAE